MKKLLLKLLRAASRLMSRQHKLNAIREDYAKSIARNKSAEIRRQNLLAINPLVQACTGVEPKFNQAFVKWVFSTTDWTEMNRLQQDYVMSSKANSRFPELSAQFAWAGMVVGIHLDHLQRIGEGVENPLSKDFFMLWQTELAHGRAAVARPSAAHPATLH